MKLSNEMLKPWTVSPYHPPILVMIGGQPFPVPPLPWLCHCILGARAQLNGWFAKKFKPNGPKKLGIGFVIGTQHQPPNQLQFIWSGVCWNTTFFFFYCCVMMKWPYLSWYALREISLGILHGGKHHIQYDVHCAMIWIGGCAIKWRVPIQPRGILSA